MNNAGLADGLYYCEHTPGEWLPLEIADGQVFWLMRKGSILTPQTMRHSVIGPIKRPEPKA